MKLMTFTYGRSGGFSFCLTKFSRRSAVSEEPKAGGKGQRIEKNRSSASFRLTCVVSAARQA